MKAACTDLSSFLLIACSWFALMELFLRHPGLLLRATVAALVILHATLTRAYARCRSTALRSAISLGAVAALLLGIYAVLTEFRATDFEGYILLIGLALALQGLLTLAFTLTRPHLRHA